MSARDGDWEFLDRPLPAKCARCGGWASRDFGCPKCEVGPYQPSPVVEGIALTAFLLGVVGLLAVALWLAL